MAIDTTRKIGNDTFSISLLSFEETCDLLPLWIPAAADFGALYALFLGTMAKAAGDGEDVGGLEVMDLLRSASPALSEASAILARISEKLPPDKLRLIRKKLLTGATMNDTPLYAMGPGQPDLIGSLLRGRTLDGWRLMIFALEVNYPDFFEIVRPFVGSGKKDGSSSSSIP